MGNTGKDYDYSSMADKHFFGGYFNLAQNNIDLAFKNYVQRFNVTGDKNKEGNIQLVIKHLSEKDLSDSDFRLRSDYLSRIFPFINYLNKDDRVIFGRNVKLFFKAIKSLRNFYTHYYHAPLSFDKDLFTLLDDIMLKVVKDVRKKRMKTDESKLLLKKQLSKEISILVDKQKRFLLEIKKRGINVSLDAEIIHNSIFNSAFHHLIFNDKKTGNEVLSKYYSSKRYEEAIITENEIAFSQSGIVFLLGLFLSKKESEELRAQIRGFKARTKETEPDYPNFQSNSLKYMATHWVFSYLAFKGVKQQLITTTVKDDESQEVVMYHKETLLLQIADELSKVPDAVYNALPKKIQESFVEDINEYIKEEKYLHSLEESIVVHPVIRKRYDNKFQYFALRYLDEFVAFPSLRFQIHVGNFVHDNRQKEIAGTKYLTERIIKEKINAFGKLSEIDYLKKRISLKKETDNSLGWELFPNPSYNIEDGNIMIYIKVDKELKNKISKYKGKETARAGNKPAKYVITGKISGKLKVNPDKPTAQLSLNELPALLYELLIKNTTPEEIEKQICQRIEEQFNTLEKYQNGGNYSTSQIPGKLLKSSSECLVNENKLLAEIRKEMAVCDQKEGLLKKNRNETKEKKRGLPVRKFVFNKKEIGEETTWLAKDLVRFMPKDIRKEWKGYAHSQLQFSLAFYDTRTNEAFEMLKSLWNLDSDAYPWNEGIREAFKKKDFEHFYEAYINSRKGIYQNLETVIVNSQASRKLLNKAIKQHHIWTLFTKREFEIASTQKQIEELLAKPIVLPRGLFDDKPTFINKVNVHDQPEKFADWYRYANCMEHRFQRFYDYERNYEALFKENKLKPEKEHKKSLEKLTIENDLYIKRLKTQDLFLKLIVENLYKDVFKHEINFDLYEFYFTREERLEQTRIANQQHKREKGDTSENKIKENFFWSRTIPYNEGQIRDEGIKLKDIGKFKRLLTDDKVRRIFQYDPGKFWTKQELDKELESYERIRREELLKEIHKLENIILRNNGVTDISPSSHPKDLEKDDGSPFFKKYIISGVLRKHLEIDEIDWLEKQDERSFEHDNTLNELSAKNVLLQKAFFVVYIRNKFAHNQLLTTENYFYLLKLCQTKKMEEKTYSETILRCLELIINNFVI